MSLAVMSKLTAVLDWTTVVASPGPEAMELMPDVGSAVTELDIGRREYRRGLPMVTLAPAVFEHLCENPSIIAAEKL